MSMTMRIFVNRLTRGSEGSQLAAQSRISGLVVALYSGIGSIGNVRSAVQAQWRTGFRYQP